MSGRAGTQTQEMDTLETPSCVASEKPVVLVAQGPGAQRIGPEVTELSCSSQASGTWCPWSLTARSSGTRRATC